MQIKLDRKKLDNLLKISKDVYKVKVGVINGGGEKAPDGNLTVAGYGYINEVGSIINNIPQRSFIRSPLSLKLKQEMLRLKETYAKLFFKEQKIKEAYNILGLSCKGIILDAFSTSNGGAWAPNSAFTIKKKGSSKPLIDTGRLRKSIDFKVIKNK